MQKKKTFTDVDDATKVSIAGGEYCMQRHREQSGFP